MHSAPTSSYSYATSCPSSAGSADSVFRAGMSINLEELIYVLVGDFELKFYRHGQLVSCGSLGRQTVEEDAVSPHARPASGVTNAPETDAPETEIDVPETDAPDYARGSQQHEDTITLSEDECYPDISAGSAYADLHLGPDAGTQSRVLPIDALLTNAKLPAAEPPRPASPALDLGRLPRELAGSPAASASRPTSERALRRSRIRKRRELAANSRKLFVMNAMPLPASPQITPKLEALWRVFSLFTQTQCRMLAITSIAALQPARRVTHPYGGKAPEWWPAGLRYVDPSHLFAHERQALILYLWLSKEYLSSDVRSLFSTLRCKLDARAVDQVLYLVLEIRTLASS